MSTRPTPTYVYPPLPIAKVSGRSLHVSGTTHTGITGTGKHTQIRNGKATRNPPTKTTTDEDKANHWPTNH